MVTMQPNIQVHDDLAALFSRNLTFHPPPPEPKSEPRPEPHIAYSISQHYHHSSHVITKKEDEQPQYQQRPSSLPPHESGPTFEQILTAHGVNPAVLSYAQVQLFKTADNAQRLRLLELWCICPPAPNNTHHNPALAWNTTTVQHEETLAKMRYERQQQDELAQRQQAEFEAQQKEWRNPQTNESMSLDSTIVTFQRGDGRCIALANSDVQDPEPYMASGYEQMAQKEYELASKPKDAYSHFGTAVGGPNNPRQYNQATDPAYRQYGGFQMRGTCGVFDEMEVI